jgi:ribosomal protein S18 acetylase RimI-like enzyme
MLNTRFATSSDASLIAAHRRAMFQAMGKSDPSVLAQMSRHFEPWVKSMIEAQKYVGWIVEDAGQPAASAGFFLLDWPPHPFDPESCHRGYLLNFWVEPKFRNRGLARSLVTESLAEARRRRIRVVALHASDAGRPVYEAMGFSKTNEMFHVDALEP